MPSFCARMSIARSISVRRLGHAERAAIGDAARRLVGVDAVDQAIRSRECRRSRCRCENSPAGHLVALAQRVERAVVGDRVEAQARDPAVLGRGDLRLPCGSRARRPVVEMFSMRVLDPLHRHAGDDRGDDRADVAGIGADLVAEAAADVAARSRGSCAPGIFEISEPRCGCTCGAWKVPQSVRSPLTLSNEATHWQVSSGHGWHARVLDELLDRDRRALSNAASAAALSPASQVKMWFGCLRGPWAPSFLSSMSSRMTGASSSIAFIGSTLTGSSS